MVNQTEAQAARVKRLALVGAAAAGAFASESPRLGTALVALMFADLVTGALEAGERARARVLDEELQRMKRIRASHLRLVPHED